MKLYNSLRKQLDELTPLEANTVRIYSCGPTVYDHAHIGNLSAYIFADSLRRVITSSGNRALHAMNYTDVDDKTIRRSQTEYAGSDPMTALRQLTDHYIALFLQDMQAVGNDTDALDFIRATDTINEMQQLIRELHKAGFAYIAADGVYFSIDAYRRSGKTYGQLLELTSENTSEARIQNDEYDKDSVHDFALWKTKKSSEPAWEFSLDDAQLDGRPGWHIECSVMSRLKLGQPFDIHTGGVDLIFPHHENEIAQSTALESNPLMAQIFSHNEHVLVDGRKMSKSLGNFYTLADITDKGFDPLAFRLLILQAHYRSQVNFSWESLQAAQNRLASYRNMAALRFQPTDTSEQAAEFTAALERINTALGNDVNTPQALSELSEVEAVVSKLGVSPAELPAFTDFLQAIDALFGLNLLAGADISESQKQLIQRREIARNDKDWAASDTLRQQLQDEGLGINDTPQGPIWFRL